jgi:tRNA pseudouridine55 synthase
MDGVLNINKPRGLTSHDVVMRVRRIFGEKKVGHTGTLDPSATGVLVVCIGRATRIAQYLEAGEKEYHAVMRMGVTTDTLDAEGRILDSRTYVSPDRSRVLDVLKQFIGPILQTPPAYSAIKVGGIPSYKLARQGKAEPLKPRAVTVRSIDLCEYNDPLISLRICCSKGVYIRTLCADIGEALGTGAHLTSLVRIRSGGFRIAQAFSLDQIAFLDRKDLRALLVPMSVALDNIPEITVNDRDSDRIVHGMKIERPEQFLPGEIDILVRLHDSSARLLALGRAGREAIRPEKVF